MQKDYSVMVWSLPPDSLDLEPTHVDVWRIFWTFQLLLLMLKSSSQRIDFNTLLAFTFRQIESGTSLSTDACAT